MKISSYTTSLVFFSVALSACAPTPGPDKAIAGAILGAGWGAGAGAVIGNQTNATGPGVAIGAGFGAADGLLTGAALDLEESAQLQSRRELRALKQRVALNEEYLLNLRGELEGGGRVLTSFPANTDIFFDPNLAALRLGSAKELERLADAIKRDYLVRRIDIYGHSDDTGTKDENEKLSVARARAVQGFLSNQGISTDITRVYGVASAEPRASNRSEAGRQLNRRVEIVLVR